MYKTWIFGIILLFTGCSQVVFENVVFEKNINCNSKPIEQREKEFVKYLNTTVRIWSNETYGSGTIIYYDSKYAYIASCGHLWSKNKSYYDLKKEPLNCMITVWYQNNKKLSSSKNYKAELLFSNNKRGNDCSLLRFIPDWQPDYFPIASENYQIKSGSKQHSLGCDGTREVAHYEVEIIGYNQSGDLVTKFNSPRPGRSGGGLISNDNYYIGTCWGTNDSEGKGVGYFTSLKSIYLIYQENEYGWLLNAAMAREIPIKNREEEINFPKDYIPIPGKN